MSKSEFLQLISNMTHEEINEYFKKANVRTKKIYPLIILGPQELEKDKLNKKITNMKEKEK